MIGTFEKGTPRVMFLLENLIIANAFGNISLVLEKIIHILNQEFDESYRMGKGMSYQDNK